MRIYMAGKISRHDWRFAMVSPVMRPAGDDDVLLRAYTSADGLLEGKNAILGRYTYIGPYFIDCGHGCTHVDDEGSGGHGGGNHGAMGSCLPITVTRGHVYNYSKRAIESADIVFAWLNETDCHGTLFELGLAAQAKKEIWIAGKQRIGELWFAYQSATSIWFAGEEVSEEPLQIAGLRQCEVQWLKRLPYQQYLETDYWKGRRADFLLTAANRCQVCGRAEKTLEIHHLSYERKGAELDSDLKALCRNCHQAAHDMTAKAKARRN